MHKRLSAMFIWLTVIVMSVKLCTGQDLVNVQKHKTNLDFLQHESGAVAPNQNYESLFPSLPSKSVPVSPLSKPVVPQSSGKRDYVAPDFAKFKPSTTHHNTGVTSSPTSSTTRAFPQQSSGKRDYVASDFPSLKPQSSNQNKGHTTVSTVSPSTSNKNMKQTNSIRDYVAPQFTTPSSALQSNGKVKDLINFFGGQANNNKPSYSSVIGGGQSTPSTIKPTQAVPSSTARINNYGSTIPSSPWTNRHPTTAKSTIRIPAEPTTNARNPGTQRPPSALLPSQANINKKDQNSGSGPSDSEIESLSEELLRKDSNNAAKLITVNLQERTTFMSKDDKAPQPLFAIPQNVWSMPTVQKFIPLLDNFERDTTVNEYVTPQEKNEENAFMDAIMSTAVIRHLMNFLKEKGYVTPDPRQQRDFLKQLWFSLYARSRGKLSSSGFEHIFVSELKNGEVSGLHNWIYFSREEAANRVNYLGYQKHLQLNDKGAILKLHFNQQGADKPADTMFIGTSPELEIALYTLCFVTRADKECKIKLAGKSLNIVTHTFRYRSKNLIGSAYPQI